MSGPMSTPSVEDSVRWSHAQLNAMRYVQDPVADSVVAELFTTGQVDSVNRLMLVLIDNDGLINWA